MMVSWLRTFLFYFQCVCCASYVLCLRWSAIACDSVCVNDLKRKPCPSIEDTVLVSSYQRRKGMNECKKLIKNWGNSHKGVALQTAVNMECNFISLLSSHILLIQWSTSKHVNLKLTRLMRQNTVHTWARICLLYTRITVLNLSAFVYRLFHEDFSPIIGTDLFWRLKRNFHETVCKQIQII